MSRHKDDNVIQGHFGRSTGRVDAALSAKLQATQNEHGRLQAEALKAITALLDHTESRDLGYATFMIDIGMYLLVGKGQR